MVQTGRNLHYIYQHLLAGGQVHATLSCSFCFYVGKLIGFPCGSSGKESPFQCCRPGFDPWVGKISWRRERLPTSVFWPGEFHGLYSPWGRKEPDMTEWLSLSLLGKFITWEFISREFFFFFFNKICRLLDLIILKLNPECNLLR